MITRNQVIAEAYRHFRQDKQLPVTLYITLQSMGVDPEKLQERYEETKR